MFPDPNPHQADGHGLSLAALIDRGTKEKSVEQQLIGAIPKASEVGIVGHQDDRALARLLGDYRRGSFDLF